MGATAELGAFAAGLCGADLPDDVRRKLLMHTLDQVGAQIVGSTRSWNRAVREYALDTGAAGPATVVGGDRRLNPEWAALSNATAGHGLEIDDYHAKALSHPGCVVVPAVLAIGEATGAGGDDVLAALAAGFEAIVRIGLAVMPSMLYDRGFHETCTEGVFGAALAAGRLRGLDPDLLTAALGLAGSHASGTTEYTQSAGEVKRLHAGLGAMGGLRAVELVSRGFRGPLTILEGRRGFLQAFADSYQAGALTDGLGRRWELLDCAVKPYFSCGLIHAPTSALQQLAADATITADDVEEIVVGCDRLSLVHVGRIGPHPVDMTGAQFSMEYSLALALVLGGNDFAHYAEAERCAYRIPQVDALAERVRLELDEEADRAFPGSFLARLRVRRRSDGAWLERTAYAPGSMDAPLSEEQVRAKFRRYTTPLVGAAKVTAVERAVDALGAGGPAADVLGALQ